MSILKTSILLFLVGIGSPMYQPDKNIWTDDYQTAINEARKQDKSILMVFSGSDWCKNCIALQKEVFEQDEFLNYANEHLILLKVDFPRAKKNQLSAEKMEMNKELAEKYNSNGTFPYMVLLDKNGKMIAKSGYIRGGVEAYLNFFETSLLKGQP